jgi:hypothetical protein
MKKNITAPGTICGSEKVESHFGLPGPRITSQLIGSNQQGKSTRVREARVCRKLEAKPRWHESVPLRKGPADKTVALYDSAARYRPLLESVADRILGESGKAEVAVENCLHAAASESAPDCEGAFRGWLVRLAMDEALAILHGTPPDSRHLAFPSVGESG